MSYLYVVKAIDNRSTPVEEKDFFVLSGIDGTVLSSDDAVKCIHWMKELNNVYGGREKKSYRVEPITEKAADLNRINRILEDGTIVPRGDCYDLLRYYITKMFPNFSEDAKNPEVDIFGLAANIKARYNIPRLRYH